jgi:hypothetical protein
MTLKGTISEEDIEFVEALMSANSDAVGFIPTEGIRTIAAKGGLMMLCTRNTRVGYLLSGPIKPNEDVTIYQECIDKDVRRTGGGKDLFLKFQTRATSLNAKGIRLRCASDLEANGFWQALGFKLISTDNPSNRRKRAVNSYYLVLKRDNSRTQVELFKN